MRTMYLGSYLMASSNKHLTVVVRDKTDGEYVAAENVRTDYMWNLRKFNDLIVDYIEEHDNKVFCHLSPSMKKAGFGKQDYMEA